MKKLSLIVGLSLLLAIFVSSGFAQKVTRRYGHANALTYPYHIAGVAFAKAVEEKSKGTLEVKIFPLGQLGGERDITEGLQLGTIDLQGTSLGVTGTFVKILNIYNLPFIFKGPDHFMIVTHGPLGQWVLKEVINEGEKVNLKPLSVAGPAFRVPMNNIRPINKLDDFKGLKIRTMEVPLHKDAYRALGSSRFGFLALKSIFTTLIPHYLLLLPLSPVLPGDTWHLISRKQVYFLDPSQ